MANPVDAPGHQSEAAHQPARHKFRSHAVAGLPGGIRLGLYGARQRYPAAGVDEIEFVAILAPIALDGVRQWIRATVRVH